jgi:hypothetical protein
MTEDVRQNITKEKPNMENIYRDINNVDASLNLRCGVNPSTGEVTFTTSSGETISVDVERAKSLAIFILYETQDALEEPELITQYAKTRGRSGS